MSRGGANPNWEYQLVSQKGHTNDAGLRQRAMILRGHQMPGKKQEMKKQKRQARALQIPMNLLDLFD